MDKSSARRAELKKLPVSELRKLAGISDHFDNSLTICQPKALISRILKQEKKIRPVIKKEKEVKPVIKEEKRARPIIKKEIPEKNNEQQISVRVRGVPGNLTIYFPEGTPKKKILDAVKKHQRHYKKSSR